METKNDVVSTIEAQRRSLNRLIGGCNDDRTAYRGVAFASPAQNEALLAMSRRRSVFIEELSSIVRRLGGKPRRSGSPFAGVRHSLFKLRAVVSGAKHLGDELGECVRIGGTVVDTYERAIEKTSWPKDTGDTVTAQMEELRLDHETVRRWRGAL